MLTVDLCAGAGGLTRGLRQAGFEVGIAVEVNQYTATTYRANFPEIDLIQDDLEQVATTLLKRKLQESGHLGALVAGLPCQGFSESNRRTRSTTNPRNHLYREFLRFLRALTPHWFIIENVAGITTLQSGAFLQRILRAFRSAGYKVVWEVLNASHFGVPQDRRRAFLVGNRLGIDFKFPTPLRQKDRERQNLVRDAIADLPILRNGASVDSREYRIAWDDSSGYTKNLRARGKQNVTGNIVSRNTDRVLARYKHIKPGSNWSAIPKRLMRNYTELDACHTGIYYRLEWNAPSKVIGNFRKNMLIHPTQQRGLSIREAARLQSFPDSHVFLGPLNDRQQQVGDAVPPLLAEAVAVAVLEADQKAKRSKAS